jgi:Protein of unknown function (DUF2726)/Topoisomerase DNA binding C4 zinc finger
MTANKKDNPGCLSIFLPFLRNANSEPTVHPKEKKAEPLPYRVRDDFLSPAEFSFYKVFSTLVGERLSIQSKVRLADIFFVSHPNKNRSFFSKISQKHLDFLVCDPTTMKPIFGIELDDSSHQRSDRQKRDEFVDQVFNDAGLPLLHFPVQRQYNSRDIAEKIRPLLKDFVKASTEQTQEEVNESVSDVPICPKCGIPMVLRTVKKGEHKGKQFYGCQNFPRCRSVKPFVAESES